AETARARDGRLGELGERFYASEGAFSADATEADYHAHRIGLGVPEGGRDFAFADAFPHEALMDQLGGVDFRKGCYV
ncbi:tRNA-modifying protein YgfZ, partial [Klebsiella pneumoniae]